MKKIVFTYLILLGFAFSANSQAFAKDNSKLNQIRSQEYLQWKFHPNWYYYSWYHKRVLGIRVRIPGLGVHDRGPGGIGGGDGYVRTDKRNILQEAPAIAFTNQSLKETEKQHQHTDIVYKQELAKFADRSIDIQHSLSKGSRDHLIREINKELSQYTSRKGDPKNAKILSDEVTRITSNVKIIHDSHMSNSKKREAYINLEKELKEVLDYAIRLNSINKTIYERTN